MPELTSGTNEAKADDRRRQEAGGAQRKKCQNPTTHSAFFLLGPSLIRRTISAERACLLRRRAALRAALPSRDDRGNRGRSAAADAAQGARKATETRREAKGTCIF